MNKKILITGGAGFIGYHLARRFVDQGHEVVIADNFSRGVEDVFLLNLQKDGAELLTVDLLEKDSIMQIGDDYTQIVHLAAIIGVANVMQRPFSVLKDNVLMLLNMIDLANRQKKLTRFLFPSTSEVYAGTLKFFDLPIPTPESTPLAITELEHPRTSYMLSKIYGEALCQASGLPFVIIRPHNIYGPRMGLKHVIPELLKKAYSANQNGSIEVFSVAHKRTFCYIDDALDEIEVLLDSNSTVGGTFNLGSIDNERSIGNLADIIIKITDKKLTIRSTENTPGSPSRRQPDMARTLSVMNKEKWVSMEDGVRRCYAWYRSWIFEGDTTSAS